ncbi:MAG: IPT/TIG domain-containing protein [Candidatus Omnitrophica bacterium]|nr:IPT/TIG domain-containing protein [Candidatus Omnitrophota bacterium]
MPASIIPTTPATRSIPPTTQTEKPSAAEEDESETEYVDRAPEEPSYREPTPAPSTRTSERATQKTKALLPKITKIDIKESEGDSRILISGSAFGRENDLSHVIIEGPDGDIEASIISWEDGYIECIAPGLDSGTYDVKVIAALNESNARKLEIAGISRQAPVTKTPNIGLVLPETDSSGEVIWISGEKLGTQSATSHVKFSGPEGAAFAEVVSWDDWGVSCKVPPKLATGQYKVEVINKHGISNAGNFGIVDTQPTVEGLGPAHKSAEPNKK